MFPVKLALIQTTLLMSGKEKICPSHSYLYRETWQMILYPGADYCHGQNKKKIIPLDSDKCPNICGLFHRQSPRASQTHSSSWKTPRRTGTALPTDSQIKPAAKLYQISLSGWSCWQELGAGSGVLIPVSQQSSGLQKLSLWLTQQEALILIILRLLEACA